MFALGSMASAGDFPAPTGTSLESIFSLNARVKEKRGIQMLHLCRVCVFFHLLEAVFHALPSPCYVLIVDLRAIVCFFRATWTRQNTEHRSFLARFVVAVKGIFFSLATLVKRGALFFPVRGHCVDTHIEMLAADRAPSFRVAPVFLLSTGTHLGVSTF